VLAQTAWLVLEQMPQTGWRSSQQGQQAWLGLIVPEAHTGACLGLMVLKAHMGNQTPG